MNALKSLARALMAAALIAAVIGMASPARSSAHQTGAFITLHVFECGATSGNIFDRCHRFSTHALDGAEFRVAGVNRLTNDGIVRWKPGAGTRIIRGFNLDWGYDASYVFCSNQVTGAVLFDGLSGGDDAITITTRAGQEVICDWYYLF